MADSPTAQHRARLIREMARELKQPSQSASNHDAADGSSVWDPDHEAFTSTSFGDTTNTTQRLPTLRDSAKKYRTYTRPQEPDFEIDTSMMAKAFPDFSQGAIISDDGGSSLEMSRAGNRVPTTTSNTSGDYHLMGEQQRRHISASKKTARAGSEDLRKEAMVRRASDSPKPQDASFMSTSKVEDHGSDGSRNSSGRYRRPLTETQARVRVDDDASQLSENKSENLTLNVRRTRFGGRKNQQDHTTSDVATNENNTGHDYHETTRDASTAGRVKSTASRTASDNMSNKSMPRVFLFPDTHDLSSVLSVPQQDAGRVLPRQRKPRPSRFASGEDSCNASDIQRVHTPVEDVAGQADEQAIIDALNHLYERVATLESNEDSIKQTVAELKSENVVLRADMVEQDKRRPSNDTTGTTNKLVQCLQDRLDSVAGKATAAEVTIKALTKERDAANYQLSLVSETAEGLLDKIQLLEEQRDDFKRKWVALQKQYEEELQQWKTKQESKKDILSESGSKTKRVGSLDLFDNSFRFVSGKSGPIRSTSDIRDSEAIKKAYETPIEDHESECDNSTVLHHVIEEDNSLPQNVSIGKLEDQEPKPPQQTTGIPQDLTQVSNVDTNNLVVLRKDLEEVRITRPKQPVITAEHCGQGDAVKSTISVDAPSAPDASREPSARASSATPINGKNERPNQPSIHFNYIRREEILQKVAESKAKWAASSKPSSGSFTTQQTDDSQLSSGTVIRRRPSEQLTSAFLIPDITFEKVPVPSVEEAPEPPKQASLSPLVQQLVVSLSSHKSESCSTCKRTLHPDGCDSCRAKRAGRVSKATSVSTNNNETSPVKSGRTSRSSQSLIYDNSSYDMKKQPVQEANRITLSEREQQTHHDDHGATHRSSNSPINNHTSYHAAQPQPTDAGVPALDAESMSETSQYEDQPTMRPSQHPGVALATVMKGLKAELREIKRELALRQKAYTRQDPTLGKRRRHQLREAVEALVRSAETQADRIYALQDVLEGQKAAGQAMSPEEWEETLQSIGIDCDVSALSLGEN